MSRRLLPPGWDAAAESDEEEEDNEEEAKLGIQSPPTPPLPLALFPALPPLAPPLPGASRMALRVLYPPGPGSSAYGASLFDMDEDDGQDPEGGECREKSNVETRPRASPTKNEKLSVRARMPMLVGACASGLRERNAYKGWNKAARKSFPNKRW